MICVRALPELLYEPYFRQQIFPPVCVCVSECTSRRKLNSIFVALIGPENLIHALYRAHTSSELVMVLCVLSQRAR